MGFVGSKRKWGRKLKSLLNIKTNIVASDDNNILIRELSKKLNKVLGKHSNLKGDIFLNRGNVTFILYDDFRLIGDVGIFPHKNFLRGKDKNFAFDGFEEILKII